MNRKLVLMSLQNILTSFIEQPFGTHQSPDFIIKVSRSTILRAKSSENKHILPIMTGLLNQILFMFLQ